MPRYDIIEVLILYQVARLLRRKDVRMKRRLMRILRQHVGKLVLVFTLLSPLIAGAQMKQWVDEDGVTHFESSNTARDLPAPPTGLANIPPPPIPIVRSYAGVSLDQTLSFFRRDWRARFVDAGNSGAIYLIDPLKWPPQATMFGASFSGEYMASLLIKFPISQWDNVVKLAEDKYGPSPRKMIDKLGWQDSRTTLLIHKDYREVTVYLLDNERRSKLDSEAQSKLPRF